tara:strand:+ start:733 stop:1191 length:459 start_codon:yes stop_codon:yes gene_type:complete
MQNSSQIDLQAKIFDFALSELVLRHRDSFKPLWTVDSWVKFLIWMALNTGLSGERESLEIFAQSLGKPLTCRMRSLFFERILEEPSLRVIADPAESKIFVMPNKADDSLCSQKIKEALSLIGLLENVVEEKNNWEYLDALIAIPWKGSKKGN